MEEPNSAAAAAHEKSSQRSRPLQVFTTNELHTVRGSPTAHS